jgi:hypothetical protein
LDEAATAVLSAAEEGVFTDAVLAAANDDLALSARFQDGKFIG